MLMDAICVHSSAQGQFRPPQSTVTVPLTLVMVVSVKLPLCGAVMSKLHQAVYGAGQCSGSCVAHIGLLTTDIHSDQNVQSLAGPHIDQLLCMEKGLVIMC